MDIGWQELLLVLGVALVAFGFGRVPQIAKALGQGVAGFRREVAEPVPARPVAARSDEV